MKYRVKMMIPEFIVIEADSLYDAGVEAKRLRDALDDAKGNHTITLLTIYPDTQNGQEDTQIGNTEPSHVLYDPQWEG